MKELSKVTTTLMIKEPFYGLFLMQLQKEFNTKVPTACVALYGINIKLIVNPNFWKELNFDEKVGLIKHELLHICLHHLNMTFPDKKLGMIATDMEINQYIEILPKGVVDVQPFVEKYDFKTFQSANYYYKKLKELGHEKVYNTLSCDIPDNHDWEEIDDLASENIKHVLKETAKEIKKTQGNIPGELKELIDDLFKKKEAIFNWKSFMRNWLGNAQQSYIKTTRKRPSKRLPKNPANKIKYKINVLFAVDTSASVSIEELYEAFTELHSLYKKTKCAITIMECDTQIKRTFKYKGEYTDVTGRGGTDFEPVFVEFKKNNKYDVLIYFTDGECYPPTTKVNKPVLWILSSKGEPKENFSPRDYQGHVLKIPNK